MGPSSRYPQETARRVRPPRSILGARPPHSFSGLTQVTQRVPTLLIGTSLPSHDPLLGRLRPNDIIVFVAAGLAELIYVH
jgi:hypothetical protein